jgi:fatty acid desaturase
MIKATTATAARPATRPAPDALEPEWLEVSSLAFAWRVALWAALFGAGGWLAACTSPWVVAAGVILLGVAMAHGVELSHQALHHTGFRSAAMNEITGIAMALPMLVSFYEYRINHLKHHALLGTPNNREFFDYGSETWTPKGLALRFLMLRHYASFSNRLIKAVRGGVFDEYHARYQAQVRRFYYIATLALVSLVLACALTHSFRPLLVWLSALILVASPLHAWIEMPEHYGCNERSVDVFENTRTITSNTFMTWLTNSNNFHVEHHMWANVPIQKIRRLHERCRDRSLHRNRGYWEFYKSALRGSIASAPIVNDA